MGICSLSIIPCRKDPAGTSEMVTQLLFGDLYRVLEERDGWVRIRVAADNYECWISARQHTPIDEKEYRRLGQAKPQYVADLVAWLQKKGDGSRTPVTIGANMAYLEGLNQKEFQFEGQLVSPKKPTAAAPLLNTAMRYLGAPYLWGGKTPFGIDCSGFTQMVFRLNGIAIPRDAAQQVELGHPLSFVEEALPGDLAFFDNEEGRIVHVGIVLDQQKIIHASGFVRIDKFDHYGIFSPEMRGYSHHLRVIKRILG